MEKPLTATEAWELYKQFKLNKFEPIKGLKSISRDFSKLLASDPEEYTTEINSQGYTIQSADCYHYIVVRVLELSKDWEIYAVIDTFNANNSLFYDFIIFESEDKESYILDIHRFVIYKKLSNKE
jgi:hypothetical protein